MTKTAEIVTDVPSDSPKPSPSPQTTEQKVRTIMEQTGLPENLVQDFRFASFLANSTIIPAHYQRSAANCFIAITTAKMLKLDPFFVMQGTYIFEGKLCWYSRHLQIVFKHQMGVKIQWEWNRTDESNLRCRAFVEIEGVRTDGIWISQQMAKESNWKSLLWKTAPELMLMYRSASWLVNLRFPEVLGGIGVDLDIEDSTPSKAQMELPSAPTSTDSTVESRPADLSARLKSVSARTKTASVADAVQAQ